MFDDNMRCFAFGCFTSLMALSAGFVLPIIFHAPKKEEPTLPKPDEGDDELDDDQADDEE